MDWEENFATVPLMVQGAKNRITIDEARINYVNARYKIYNEKESAWYFNVDFYAQDGFLCIKEKETTKEVKIPYDEVEYLKLRPFYFAICVGFKDFIFYAYEKNDDPIRKPLITKIHCPV